MKKIVSAFLFAVLFLNPILFAQASDDAVASSDDSDITFPVMQTRGFLHENDGRKHPLVALGGMLFFNLGLYSYNRWALGAGWAQTGWDELGHFYERELKYDNDWYWTNFVLHPYQGAVYYQVSRGSNLNKLESFGVTVLGSAIWEYLCETNAPSINDMVYTTVGSFAVGEMLYRLSLNADEISQILGHLVNPTRWWTQIWTRQKPLGTTRNIHELYLKFALGTAAARANIIGAPSLPYDGDELYPVFANPSLFVVYNDPYGHDSNDPYSQFELEISGSMGVGSGQGADCNYAWLDKKLMYHVRILSNGMLFARAPRLSENTDTTVGVSMIYDFDWHHYYELSALGPGAAFKQRVRLANSNIEWQFHGGWNILGTTDYYFYHRPVIIFGSWTAVRNYSMTTGPMALLKFRWETARGMALNLSLRGYGMYDFNLQLQTDSTEHSPGWEWIGIVGANFEIPLSKIVRLGVQDELYVKRAFYKNVPDVSQIMNEAGIYVKLRMR